MCRGQKTIEHSFLNRTLTLLPPPPKAEDLFRRRGGKTVTARVSSDDWQGQHLLDTARQLCRWLAALWQLAQDMDKSKPDHIPAWTEEGDIKLHPSPRSYWRPLASERGRVRSFLRVHLSICQPRSRGRSHIQSYPWRTKWPWWEKIGHKVVWEGKGVGMGRVGRRKLSAIYIFHKFAC